MKKIILILIILISFTLFAESQANEVFQSAIKSYEEKEFEAALEQFLKIENENIISADLFYNIGNCYFRLNKLGKSILYYKKALKVNSNFKPAQRNLKFTLTLTKDKQTSDEEDIIQSFWDKTFNFFSLNFLAIIALLFFILIIIFINITIFNYRHREKTVPIFFISIFSVFLILFLTFGFIKWKSYHYSSEAVLISQSAIGFSGPSEEFTRVFTIHEGMTFEVEREENNWSLIKLQNGLGGWIKKEDFELIKFSSSKF
ncbi:MAG: tetratricopeptide repeat protein [Candidatus Cloacimonetes bacterium]|nr:tetratricopeptide repeat protein [Candidatus Cloacimonadota bacterium]